MTIDQILKLNRTYNSEFQSCALQLTHDADRAQDLLQDVYYLILKNRDSFLPGTNFSAWVKRIIHNAYFSDYRKAKRRTNILAKNIFPDGWLRNFTTSNTADSALEEEDIRQLIDQLPPVNRRAFWLYFNGFSYQDIATLNQVPVGTVKSRLFTARKLLKRKLLQLGYSY